MLASRWLLVTYKRLVLLVSAGEGLGHVLERLVPIPANGGHLNVGAK